MATLDTALAKQGETLKALETWKETMPTEAEMLPKDKYTMFDRKEKRYRKGIHSMLFCRSMAGPFRLGNTDPRNRATEVDESIAAIEPAWILVVGSNE